MAGKPPDPGQHRMTEGHPMIRASIDDPRATVDYPLGAPAPDEFAPQDSALGDLIADGGVVPGPDDPAETGQRGRIRIGLIMGSQSDWQTLSHAAEMLATLEIGYETRIVSAHRTPDRLVEYAGTARLRGLSVIIAAAGGAAHLPGMCAAWTTLPVLGVPIESQALRGIDSLLSIVQMPAGVPVGTLAIGKPGAINAALLAASILAVEDDAVAARLEAWRSLQTASVPDEPDSGA